MQKSVWLFGGVRRSGVDVFITRPGRPVSALWRPVAWKHRGNSATVSRYLSGKEEFQAPVPRARELEPADKKRATTVLLREGLR